tara:strand:- start:8766 stop:9800 length:1035 start_codon:yes stop_codon:yes gene_type:complete
MNSSLKTILYFILMILISGCERIEIVDRWEQIDKIDGIYMDNAAMQVFSSNSIWLVGDKIWVFDGTDWNESETPNSEIYTCVSGSSDIDVWVLSHSNFSSNINGSWPNESNVFKWNGFEWKEFNNLNSGIVYNILVLDPQTIVLGKSGSIDISYDAGQNWVNYNIPMNSNCDQGQVESIKGDLNNLIVSLKCGMILEFDGVSWYTLSQSKSTAIDSDNNLSYALTYSSPYSTPVLNDYYINIFESKTLEKSLEISSELYPQSGMSDQIQSFLKNSTLDVVNSNVFLGSENIYMYDGNKWIQETEMDFNDDTFGENGIRIIHMLNNQEGWAVTGDGVIFKRNTKL